MAQSDNTKHEFPNPHHLQARLFDKLIKKGAAARRCQKCSMRESRPVPQDESVVHDTRHMA